jgi:hypothetical protein
MKARLEWGAAQDDRMMVDRGTQVDRLSVAPRLRQADDVRVEFRHPLDVLNLEFRMAKLEYIEHISLLFTVVSRTSRILRPD